MVNATFVPSRFVAEVTRAHEVNANQVFNWRKHYPEGRQNSVATKSDPASFKPHAPSIFRVYFEIIIFTRITKYDKIFFTPGVP